MKPLTEGKSRGNIKPCGVGTVPICPPPPPRAKHIPPAESTEAGDYFANERYLDAKFAAPSGVSDAMVDRAIAKYLELEPGEAENGVGANCTATRTFVRQILEAAQPQPGRVEGMDK